MCFIFAVNVFTKDGTKRTDENCGFLRKCGESTYSENFKTTKALPFSVPQKATITNRFLRAANAIMLK